MAVIVHQAASRSVPLEIIERKEIRNAFAPVDGHTKYEIASYLTSLFPELTWKLPRPRKLYTSEHHNMAIFDAVSAGFAYMARFDDTLLQTQHPA
jgi:hypothetical protein